MYSHFGPSRLLLGLLIRGVAAVAAAVAVGSKEKKGSNGRYKCLGQKVHQLEQKVQKTQLRQLHLRQLTSAEKFFRLVPPVLF